MGDDAFVVVGPVDGRARFEPKQKQRSVDVRWTRSGDEEGFVLACVWRADDLFEEEVRLALRMDEWGDARIKLNEVG